MEILMRVVAPSLVALHALVHLLGAMVYLQIGQVTGFPYKTTVLGGRWELGEGGIEVFGVLWIVAAVGLVVAAAGMFFDSRWWPPVLAAFALLSLVLTTLDWSVAWVGLVVNLVILSALFVGIQKTP